MSQGEFLPSQSFVPLRPQGRLESNQPFALVYYSSWTKAGAGAKGKAGGTGGGGRMGRWALAAREPHQDTGVIIINWSFLQS